jgi:hypothetical protein
MLNILDANIQNLVNQPSGVRGSQCYDFFKLLQLEEQTVEGQMQS